MTRLKGTKLPKSSMPTGHSTADFKCYGPPATEDGQFGSTMLCDMGCFKFGDIDTNKYYHGAVVQSSKSDSWYAYFEFGRVGQEKPSYQFIEGPDKLTAVAEYEYQMHAKNDKRGQWVNKGSLGDVLQPKPKKDCYLVRPQATRSTGLPDARTIVHGVSAKIVKSSKQSSLDPVSAKLLADLNVATTDYTRSSLASSSIPTQDAIDKARVVLNEATSVNNTLSSDAARLSNKDLGDLTSMIFSLLPKKKNRKDDKELWWLTPGNIYSWRDDLDAFEAALANQTGAIITSDMPFHLEHLVTKSNIGGFVSHWMQKATQHRHGHVGKLNLHNIWRVTKTSDYGKFESKQTVIAGENPKIKKPLHQTTRNDLDCSDRKKLYKDSGTHLLFHGTRTVNVSGILGGGLRLPKTLSNVSRNGAMFGDGIYFADDWKKSAGYCSYDGSYYTRGAGKAKNRKAFMFICDVTLGTPHETHSGRGGPPRGTHSLWGKGVANHEFIIFDKWQQNLRYLVEFTEGR